MKNGGYHEATLVDWGGGAGVNVIVVEADPLKAPEAMMVGYSVLPMLDAAWQGEVFVTGTGNIHIIRKDHFDAMPDGAAIFLVSPKWQLSTKVILDLAENGRYGLATACSTVLIVIMALAIALIYLLVGHTATRGGVEGGGLA